MFDNKEGIIWDWNGTLLNDIQLCVQTINGMLKKRNLQQLSVEKYKDVFSFPVKDYYQKIGFDFVAEPFELPALEFIEQYNKRVINCQLHEGATTVLNQFKSQGLRQFILSAMEQDTLDQCLEQRQISHFFEHVSGLDNHFAASKLDNGHRLISELNLDVSKLILIGDTVHDLEVARELGCPCMLISHGHQSKQILESTGVPVIDEIGQLVHSQPI
jgi:phosphoglycolate phosphatase